MPRCFYLEDGSYLCINIPMDDYSDPFMNVEGINKGGTFCVKLGDRCRSVDDYTVMHKFMSGWDIGRTAEYLGWERSRVSACIEEFREDMRAEDLDQLREMIWEWASEDKTWNPYAVVRVTGAVLK